MLLWGTLTMAVLVPTVICLRRAVRTLDALLAEELPQRPNGHQERLLPLSSSRGSRPSEGGCAGA